MTRRLAVSLTVSAVGRIFADDLRGLVDLARQCEAAGLDQIVMTDHLAIGARTDRYPYGAFPFPNEEPWPEPLTTLAAMAGATRRIRLGTGVLIAPLRPPLLLAKTLATLDVLSGGRVDLGVGTGWQREEFEAAGVPFEGRAARMDDTLRACRALWTEEPPVRFQSPSVGFEGLWCEPRPLQRGGIPIWFGLKASERNLARMVELGSGWMPLVADLGELREGVDRLGDAFSRAGRDPAELKVRCEAPAVLDERGRPDLERTVESLPALAEAGATHASFALARYARSREQARDFVASLGALAGLPVAGSAG
ncbi:MAG: TIGR03619 family F420-dependent LLM class oxidoreductase [Myxococcota bacterium]